MSGSAREHRRRIETSPRSRHKRALRSRAVLEPPAGLEAGMFQIGDEELLVLRVPLNRPTEHTGLSAAERDVAALALAGLSNSEIGRRRRTSARTVANQMATIFRKLGVRSRAELALNLVVKGR